jgi:formylglycine-generating enzyme required for sulfatase activity
MNGTRPPPLLFLLGQQLSQLVGVDDQKQRQFHVCGGVSGRVPDDARERAGTERDPWVRLERRSLRPEAAGRSPRRRVALVCDAGLGKTTNLEWLAAAIASEPGGRQVPLLLYLNDPHDLGWLAREHVAPGALLDRLAALVTRAAGGDTWRHRLLLDRRQAGGRITLLLDGLDHALHQPDVSRMLQEFLQSPPWRNCPVWVSGRPYAFDNAWGLFAGPEWHFLRVEPLAEPEVRFYLARQAGGDWYDEIAPDGRGLLAVPRLLRLTAGILEGEVRAVTARGEDPRRAVQDLELRTAADVYHLAYFTPGEWVDLENRVPGASADLDRRGLLASGLVGEAACIGLADGEKPSRTNYRQRLDRTAALLGAIAFEMFATSADPAHPEPNTMGVLEEHLESFKAAVSGRLLAVGQRADRDFYRDFDLLTQMNNEAVDFLLFRELGQRGLVWHDRTVQAFFAAYWAMKFSSAADRQLLQRWVVDTEGEGLPGFGFNDFWMFAAELPDALVDRARWLAVFEPCFTPPQQVQGSHDWVQWHRRMIYHSFARMQARSPDAIVGWRDSFLALARGTAKQRRIHQEIEGGFRPIPEGIYPYGADPLGGEEGIGREVGGFRLHHWPVTNAMYEEFDPRHRAQRWPGKHPLVKKRKQGDDRCPVVDVTWYDAWCFAAWCGHRLPTELEWEHACRAGSAGSWCFGNEEAELVKYAWYGSDLESGSTHPVGELQANAFGLFDMHGNVWEWCTDRWVPGASACVRRGGSWYAHGRNCRSASRYTRAPGSRNQACGFRLAAVPCAVGAGPGKEGRGA